MRQQKLFSQSELRRAVLILTLHTKRFIKLSHLLQNKLHKKRKRKSKKLKGNLKLKSKKLNVKASSWSKLVWLSETIKPTNNSWMS